ncbi:hypothetical protein J8273_1220 [Carpediemonas membranifera]|uniref:Uncharacterized protein n=1 Tax=Carpediemonas membranifera TaxID=201153 RepID=A0A8J6B328_9EUKA|nr:hypothetical protein J8273_1220 [Carpediemonas membranifera]|eukprot:KAG9397305.1 hypothetical protein J8273_1220 [Carpediemonas membranifera]
MSDSYNHRCKIGNWYESQVLDDLQLEEYKQRRERGTAASSALQIQKLLEKAVEGKFQREECISEGDMITIGTKMDDRDLVLGVDPRDPLPFEDDASTVSAGPAKKAARSLFVIRKFKSGSDDPVIRFGDAIELTSEVMDSVVLSSQPQGTAVNSPITSKQAVFMIPPEQGRVSARSKWEVVYPDTEWRLEEIGRPVKRGEALLLKHGTTGAFLNVGGSFHNLFGVEYEMVGAKKPQLWCFNV